MSNDSPTIPPRARVLIIGGGPAGSTAAGLLAKRGVDVVVLERARFPRYHIGESLLPSVLPVLDLLGVREKIDAFGFTKKHGGFMQWGGEEWSVEFDILSEDRNYSYQVKRADFDNLMLEHAESLGAKVFQETAVEAVEFEGERPVRVRWSSGERSGTLAFDFLIDASGRKGVMATKYLRSREMHPIFQNVAMWRYWEGCTPRPNAPSGAILNAAVPEGWFWSIPLHDGTTSVGLVIHKDKVKDIQASVGLERFYLDAVASCEVTASTTAGATPCTELRVETDYSYTASEFHGPGYMLCGDAACFLDPLLSSGIHLAMFSALLATAAITSVLDGEVDESTALSYFGACYRRAYLRLLVFVSSFYNQYEGKEGYFWDAHRLTNLDLDSVELEYAFTSLISGLEDMKVVSGDVAARVFGEMERQVKAKNDEARGFAAAKAEGEAPAGADESVNRDFFGSRVEGLFALEPSEAIHGLYVSLDEGPRLARVEVAAAV